MKRALLILGAGFALALAPPLSAQEAAAEEQADPAPDAAPEEEFVFLTEEEQAIADLEQEITAAFGVLGEMYKVAPLTPEQEARVPLGQEMALAIMPEGSFGVAMNESLKPMMTAITGTATDDPRVRLAEISGVESDDLASLDNDAAQEALDIFDPQYAARTQRTNDVMLSMITKLLEAVEPTYRDALARALAVRFAEDEMRELLTFFATPVGGKFAAHSFLVQFDPQMMGVIEAMGPAFVTMMPDLIDEATAIEAEFAAARDFTELSAAERARAARLIGKSVSELDALVPEVSEDESAAEDAVT